MDLIINGVHVDEEQLDEDDKRTLCCVGGTFGCLAFMSCPLGIVSLALNIWNLVICSKVLNLGLTDDCLHSNFQIFIIGSIVCSAITLLGCGLTVPVPHLVFAILGHSWRSNALTLCSATSPALLLSTITKSVAVLYVTFAFNAALIVVMCCAPYCVMGATFPLMKKFGQTTTTADTV